MGIVFEPFNAAKKIMLQIEYNYLFPCLYREKMEHQASAEDSKRTKQEQKMQEKMERERKKQEEKRIKQEEKERKKHEKEQAKEKAKRASLGLDNVMHLHEIDSSSRNGRAQAQFIDASTAALF